MGREKTGVSNMDKEEVIEYLDESFGNNEVVIMAMAEDILPDEIYKQITKMLAEMVCDNEHPLQFEHLEQMQDSKNMGEISICLIQGLH